MSATYMHIGIPITNKKPGMNYVESMKLWMSNPEDYDYKIEYLKFEEGGPFPEIMHKNPHVAYKVDDMQKYLDDSDEVIFPKTSIAPGTSIAFIIKDNTIIELYEQK
jgi:hypothetical protein